MERRILLLAASLSLVAALAVPARSQTPAREGFVGEWRLEPEPTAARRVIRSAYDRVLRDANPLIRAIARERLNVDQQLPRRIRIQIGGGYITTTMRTTRRIHWRTRERYPTQVTGDDGREVELTQHFRGDRLELASSFPEGRRWIVFTREGEDRMTMSTTIDPMMIDDNVHFTLSYRRET